MTEAPDHYIHVKVSDGTTMAAYVSRPSGNRRHPAIMLFQEAYGVNAHIRDVADRFAQQGYVTIAPELYHRTAPGFEGTYGDFASTRPHFSVLTNDNLFADIQATFDWLQSDKEIDSERIASVGFCMGGRVSYLANSHVPVKAAVSFYGGGIAPGNLGLAPQLHAPMLLFWGGLDKNIGPDQALAVVNALRAGSKKFVNVEFSDADHGFFCEVRASYNRAAAQQAWSLLNVFLDENLKGNPPQS